MTLDLKIKLKQENNNLKKALRELVNNHKIKDCTKPQNCICDSVLKKHKVKL